ncbi:MAG: T9SS type A sorting domain-containing protein [Bacteroidales bacterium]|nr:T9SS type A sorting domain-containing protein [Bacteroidales bacterium]
MSNSTYRGHASSKGMEFHVSALNTPSFLILPPFQESLENLSVVFWSRPESSDNQSGRLDIGYITDAGDATTFVVLSTINTTDLGGDTAYHKYRVNFNDIELDAENSARIAFRHTSNNTSFYWYLDDVRVEAIPDCSEASQLATSNITSESADLSWSVIGSPSINLYYKTSDASTYEVIENVELNEDNVYTLNNLASSTTYSWYLVSSCGETEVQSETRTFKTTCTSVSILPYEMDFEGYASSGYPGPDCWNLINRYSNYPYVYNYSSYAHQGSGLLYFYPYSTGTNIISLPLIETPINQLRLTAWMKPGSNTSSYGRMEIGVTTDLMDTNSFQLVQTITAADLQNSNYAKYEVDFSSVEPADGVNYYITFRCLNVYGYAWYLDDVTVDLIPACATPSNLTASNITGTGAELSWTAPESANEFTVYYKSAAATEYIVAEENVTEHTYILNDLNYSTTYQWKVSFVCPDNEMIVTSEASSFTTTCGTVVVDDENAYLEEFTSASQCWTTTGLTYSDGYIYHGYGTYNVEAISPVFDISGVTSPYLKFSQRRPDFTNSGVADSLIVSYRADQSGSWTELVKYGDVCSTWRIDSIALTEASETYQVKFTFIGMGYNANGAYLDNVQIYNDAEPVEPIEPTVETSAATNVTETTATLHGTITLGNQTITARGFEWKESTAANYTSVSATGTNMTYNLSNLTPNTTYTYHAFVTTANGTQTGDEVEFTTLEQSVEPCTPTTEMITATVCYGESYEYNGVSYSTSGTHTLATLTNVAGCDSTVILNLTVRPQNTSTQEVEIASNELPYQFGSQSLTAAGTYTEVFEDANGCDSTVTLTLTVTSGLNDVVNNLSVSLYPNPTNANATLSVKGLNEDATIIVTDQQGKVISTMKLAKGSEIAEIETTNLASGVYYVRIQTANAVRTEKLIKK